MAGEDGRGIADGDEGTRCRGDSFKSIGAGGLGKQWYVIGVARGVVTSEC